MNAEKKKNEYRKKVTDAKREASTCKFFRFISNRGFNKNLVGHCSVKNINISIYKCKKCPEKINTVIEGLKKIAKEVDNNGKS